MKKLFLISAVILGLSFTACKDNNEPEQKKERNTHVSVALRLGGSSAFKAPAADPNDYNDVGEWAGQDKISRITIYLVGDSPSGEVQSDELGIDTAYVVTPSGTSIELKPTRKGAIKTSPGKKTVFVVINETPAVKAHLNTKNTALFIDRYKNLDLVLGNTEYNKTDADVETSASKLAKSTTDAAGYDNIVMTNVPGTSFDIDVKESISAEDTTPDSGSPENRAAVTVERAVARVMITTKSISYDVKVDDVLIGTISDITWSLAQGEKALYVQRKADWKTPQYDWVSGGTTTPYIDGTNGAWGRYDYSGLYKSATIPTLADYTTLVNGGNVVRTGFDENAMNGEFLLPSTHLKGDETTSGYRKGNTPYVLVRTKFTPTNLLGDSVAKIDGTFYYGGQDHKFYKSAQDARNAGNTAIAKYAAGKTIYYAWVNPDKLPEWLNSPVLRNNIYHIHVTGFRNLGLNWNPLFPEDPDNPNNTDNPNGGTGTFENPDPKVPVEKVVDPDNPGGGEVDPEEPTNPVDPEDPLTTPDTWMSVDVTILPWNVHSYQVDLGI